MVFYNVIKYFTDVLGKNKNEGSLFTVSKYLCVCDVVLSHGVYCQNSRRYRNGNLEKKECTYSVHKYLCSKAL